MKQIFFDNELQDLFKEKASFSFAEEIQGETYRKHANRITKRIEVNEKGYFLKIHGPVGWREVLKNLIQLKVPVIGALREFNAIKHLSQSSINSLEVVGFFQEGISPANSRSFLITKELEETISLEDFFLEGLHKRLSFKQKKILIEQTAKTIRQIHDSGLNHRDLYLCHLHVEKEINFEDLKITTIDLHRSQIRNNVPERWLIKDLGGFLHSAMGFGLTERDCYRFFKNYFSCSFKELCEHHSVLVRKILDRAFSMYLKPRLKPFKIVSTSPFPESSIFSKDQDKSGRWLFNKEIPLNLFMEFIKDEDLLISEGKVIKDEEGHLVVEIEIQGTNYFFKKYRIKNLIHGLSRVFKKTRAYNSWVAYNWMTAVGIQTSEPVLIFIQKGFFGKRNSFLVTKAIAGQSLDEAISNNVDSEVIVSGIVAFFKKLSWINFSHGDAKSSNFFIFKKSIIALDLDTAGKQGFISIKKNISKDKKRMLKSLANQPSLHQRVSKRI